jgi:hypothetical protein
MKKIIISAIVVLVAITACAQTNTNENSSVQSDNTLVYRLFPTTNMWTFIKLNTRTGQMWQVQYSTKGEDYRFETYLSLTPLVLPEEEVNGRFTLYSTQNIYNFVLLDQLDGRVWQVQWSMEAEDRAVIPIE